jgi:hypothetical protein
MDIEKSGSSRKEQVPTKGVSRFGMKRFLSFVGKPAFEMVQSSGRARFRAIKREIDRCFWVGSEYPREGIGDCY